MCSALSVHGPPWPPRSYCFPKQPAPAIFYFPLPDSGQICLFLFPVTSYLLSHRILCPLDFLQTLCPGVVLQPRVTSGLTLGGIDLFPWRGRPARRPPAKCCRQQAAASPLSPSCHQRDCPAAPGLSVCTFGWFWGRTEQPHALSHSHQVLWCPNPTSRLGCSPCSFPLLGFLMGERAGSNEAGSPWCLLAAG